ncbi:MAG: YajQ family cyclic di-GMP-binding protein [Phycisphaerae bacterium]
MADNHSFDIVSEINWMELNNAIIQAQKEIGTRYDFRGSTAAIGAADEKEKTITITADNEPQLNAVMEVLIGKLTKRGVDSRCLDRTAKVEQATHKTLRHKLKLKQGIDRETAKSLQKSIKDMGLKVQVQIQGEALRVVSPKLDDLQTVIAAVKAKPQEVALQFTNYR